jgi:release factor glutamine methyltransferase
VTVLEVIQRSTDFFAKKGVDSPRLQAEWLLAHVLQLPRLKLYLEFNRTLSDEEMSVMRELARRRGEREPLQHILGSASFCGLEIKIGPQVLVPRPETELLAERAWQHLAACGARPPAVLDFGTGSGCIAIAIAVHCSAAEIHALDISTEALTVARANAEAHGVDARIHFHAGDGFSGLPKGLAFDLIVSNPPYIPSDEIDGLSVEVREHDPRLALDGGQDGLSFYRLLAAEGGGFLRREGRMIVELGDGQAEQIREILVQHNWVVESVRADYSLEPRILTARRQ